MKNNEIEKPMPQDNTRYIKVHVNDEMKKSWDFCHVGRLDVEFTGKRCLKMDMN